MFACILSNLGIELSGLGDGVVGSAGIVGGSHMRKGNGFIVTRTDRGAVFLQGAVVALEGFVPVGVGGKFVAFADSVAFVAPVVGK